MQKKISYIVSIAVLCIFLASCHLDPLVIPESPVKELAPRKFPIQFGCGIDDKIEAKYLEDAHILAVRLMRSENLQENDSIAIPPDYVNSILKALSAISAEESVLLDSILEELNIKAHWRYSLRKLSLTVDRSVVKIDEWLSGSVVSSSPKLQELIKNYELEVNQIQDCDQGASCQKVKISAGFNVNTYALANELHKLDGIDWAASEYNEPDSCLDDIAVFIEDGQLKFEFRQKSTTCTGEFSFGKYWSGSVSSNCVVSKFVTPPSSEFDVTVTGFGSCYLTTIIFEEEDFPRLQELGLTEESWWGGIFHAINLDFNEYREVGQKLRLTVRQTHEDEANILCNTGGLPYPFITVLDAASID